MNRFHGIVIAAITLSMNVGCAGFMTRSTADMTVDVMIAGKPSVDRETDLTIARTSAEANLGMMGGLAEIVPKNEALLLLMAEAYGGYAFAFVEDDLDQLDDADDAYEPTLERAYALYGRSVRAAQAWLQLQHEGLPDMTTAGDAHVSRALGHMTAEDVPALFWLANSWSSQVNLKQDDPMEILNLGRIEAIMKRALELDDTYFDGGPHLFYGVLRSSAPKALSDQTEEAAKSFARAWAISKQKNLMIRALEARYLLVQMGDRGELEAALESIVEADIDSPRHNLINSLAKRRAARWLDNIDALIPEE